MDPDFAQRRRLAVALAITVIAVPAAFLLNRAGDDPETSPAPTVVGTVPAGTTAPGGADDAGTAPAATDAMGTMPANLLDGTEPPQADGQARIAIPRTPEAITGTATFRHSIADTTACQVRYSEGVPFNAEITVTNLDNSRSVQCVASVGGAEPDDVVVLNADAFLQIADFTDAPVPVQITW